MIISVHLLSKKKKKKKKPSLKLVLNKFRISRLTSRLPLILCNFSSPFISTYLNSLTIHWKFSFDFSTISILTSEKCRCDKLSNHFALLVALITLARQV